MEPLFTTQTDLNLEEYKKFNAAAASKTLESGKLKKRLKWICILLAVCLLEIIIFNLLPGHSDQGNTFTVIFTTAAVVIAVSALSAYLLMRFPFFLNKSAEKAYYSNPFLQKNHLQIYSFYEEYLEEKSNDSSAKIEYALIHNIIETETNFYIMIGNNQGYVIIKSNCSPELIEFIKNLKPKQGSK
ncbi:MAG: YcxB family protein [Eubacterium sp.]|nr:YcxB family protein [Eubacterium sp.]